MVYGPPPAAFSLYANCRYDQVVETLHSPFDGIVRMLFTVGVANTGDRLHLWQTRTASA